MKLVFSNFKIDLLLDMDGAEVGPDVFEVDRLIDNS